MTSQDYGTLIVDQKIREKLVNKLQREFPRFRERADDWAARAILYGLRKSPAFKDAVGAMAYVMEKGIFLALKDREREIERRNTLQGLPRAPKQRDPMRRVDFKVDLEKAVRLTTGNKLMQQALWHIHFEEWTWDEVIEALPQDVLPDTWRKRILRTNEDLQRRLRAYGYRG